MPTHRDGNGYGKTKCLIGMGECAVRTAVGLYRLRQRRLNEIVGMRPDYLALFGKGEAWVQYVLAGEEELGTRVPDSRAFFQWMFGPWGEMDRVGNAVVILVAHMVYLGKNSLPAEKEEWEVAKGM